MRRSLVLVALSLLAGCGVKTDLKPQAGEALPVAPYGRADRPASPERSVELRNRSEEREDDPFDLPPED